MRNKREKQRRSELTPAERFELMGGPSPEVSSVFATDDDRRAAWEEHRDEIMDGTDRNGPPWSWWQYQVGHHPDKPMSYLAERGLLSQETKAEILDMANYLQQQGDAPANILEADHLGAAEIIRRNHGKEATHTGKLQGFVPPPIRSTHERIQK